MKPDLVIFPRLTLSSRIAALVACIWLQACTASPTLPSSAGSGNSSTESVVGELAVAFLNRFSTSNIEPSSCLLDFANNCSGKSEELADITFNRDHYAILSARLGEPSVRLTGSSSATVTLSCGWDSRVNTCPGKDCTVGQYEHVAGTCTLTAVRQDNRWWLCTSRFAGTGFVSPAFLNFFSASAN